MAVQLAAAACDAWLQLTGASTGRITAWGAVAHGASLVAGALLLFFVADLLRQSGRPDDAEADVARAIMRQAQLAIGAIVVLGGWLLWDLGRYASADALTRDVHRFVDGPFSVSLAILCTMPVALLRALWSHTPRTRARWVLWLPDGGQPLTTLALGVPVPLPPATLSVGDFRAVATLASVSLLILLVGSLSTSSSWTPATIGLLTLCRIGLLLSTMVIHVVARYLFLDVVLRRALVAFSLAVVLGGGVFLMVNASPARQAQLASIAILVVLSCLAGCEWLLHRLRASWGLFRSSPFGSRNYWLPWPGHGRRHSDDDLEQEPAALVEAPLWSMRQPVGEARWPGAWTSACAPRLCASREPRPYGSADGTC